jgi:hypothetical protein
MSAAPTRSHFFFTHSRISLISRHQVSSVDHKLNVTSYTTNIHTSPDKVPVTPPFLQPLTQTPANRDAQAGPRNFLEVNQPSTRDAALSSWAYGRLS